MALQLAHGAMKLTLVWACRGLEPLATELEARPGGDHWQLAGSTYPNTCTNVWHSMLNNHIQ